MIDFRGFPPQILAYDSVVFTLPFFRNIIVRNARKQYANTPFSSDLQGEISGNSLDLGQIHGSASPAAGSDLSGAALADAIEAKLKHADAQARANQHSATNGGFSSGSGSVSPSLSSSHAHSQAHSFGPKNTAVCLFNRAGLKELRTQFDAANPFVAYVFLVDTEGRIRSVHTLCFSLCMSGTRTRPRSLSIKDTHTHTHTHTHTQVQGLSDGDA